MTSGTCTNLLATHIQELQKRWPKPVKSCSKHGYNPPSACPNCRIASRRERKRRAAAGWETRRKNQTAQQQKEHQEQQREYARHGWSS